MANYKERRQQLRMKVKWPITIYTDKGPVEGEARNITGAGVFIHCGEQLRQNEVCRMVIRLPEERSVEVQGKLMWSNLDNLGSKGPFTGMGFSFVKFSDEDRALLNEVISKHSE